MTARVVICSGSGGVGKTTISAALALKWAMAGARVAVLTIDPAKRLADTLSIGDIGNVPCPVPIEHLSPKGGGRLDAMMLDAKATFDELVHRFAPSPDVAERILANRYYQFTSSRLGGSHEYMAMERLLDLWQDDQYDIIVLDTPPTRHALDFLEAPKRLGHLLDQGVLRWLIMPATQGGWRALEIGSEAVARVLKRVVGQGTIAEIADFFDAFRDLWGRFRDRSERVQVLLKDPSTRFLLVTSPTPAARTDALFFLRVLEDQGLPFGGFVINRVYTAPHSPLPTEPLPPAGPLPADRWRDITQGVACAPRIQARLSQDHDHIVQELRRAAPERTPEWIVPDQGRDLHDFIGLGDLLPYLPDDLWGG